LFNTLQRVSQSLASIEVWPVAILTTAGIIFPYLLPLALVVSLLFWPVRWIADKRLSVRTPADWAIACLCITTLITLWITPVVEKTVLQVLRLICGILLFYAAVNWVRIPERIKTFSLVLVLTGFFLALLAPAIVEWVIKLPLLSLSIFERFTVLVSDTANPNVYAGTLVILLPLALSGVLFGERPDSILKWISRLTIPVVMIIVLALTQSRGAWLAFVVASIGMVLLRWRRGWLALPLVGIGLAVLLVIIGPTRLAGYILSNSNLGGTEGRLVVWSQGIALVNSFPFTGIGLGAFPDVVRGLFPFAKDIYRNVPHVHNLFLQIAIDLGLPGLLAWLAILETAITASWRIYRRGRAEQDAWMMGLGAGLVCSQIALGVHGLTDSVTWGMVRPAPLVWAVWGLAVASWMVFGEELYNL
jgi:putative inorganic carbon (HCO3(-)) transporter